MRRMLILILVPLGWAIPASAQNSPPDQAAQQAPACQAPSAQSIGQNIRSDLARAGYRDIQMVPDSFVVRAKDPTGVSVMMVLSPNSITVVTEATPDETSGLPADVPPDADTPASDRCVLPNAEEGLVGAIPRSILHSTWPQLEQGRTEPPAYSRRFGWDERPGVIRLEQEASLITVSRLDGDQHRPARASCLCLLRNPGGWVTIDHSRSSPQQVPWGVRSNDEKCRPNALSA